MRPTVWVVGGMAAGLMAAMMVGLGHTAQLNKERSAARFAMACEASGFAPRQCAFLAELDRRSRNAGDDAAMAEVQAANASLQAAARP